MENKESTSPAETATPDNLLQAVCEHDGKYKGKKYIDIDEKYLNWLASIKKDATAIALINAYARGEIRREDAPPEETVSPIHSSVSEREQEIAPKPMDNSAVDLIKELVSQLSAANGNQYRPVEPINLHAYTQQGIFDPNDIMPKPAVFFAPKVSYGILDYTIDGKLHPHPFRKAVEFTFLTSFKQVTGSGERDFRILQFCQYICKSKKEYLWLKGSPDFIGGKIFEKTPDMKSMDMEMYECEVEAGDQLGRMDVPQLLAEAQRMRSAGHRIPITEDLAKVRTSMRKIIAEQILADRKKAIDLRLNMSVKDQVAFNEAGGVLELQA